MWMKKGNNIQTAKIYPQCVTAVAYKNVPYQKKRNYKKETSIRGCFILFIYLLLSLELTK